MAQKPDLQRGYLGAQQKFAELGLSVSSHKDSEIVADDNQIELKIKYNENQKVKVTHQLIKCSDESDQSQYVFTQTKDNTITFVIHMPEFGYYKFQIFALSADDDSKSLPNVYNYVINCVKALHPVFPFPKQYAQWKDGCYLEKPLVLHSGAPLKNVQWKVTIPGAKAVAVVADGEWFQFDRVGLTNDFEGKTDLSPYKDKKDPKITLNANFGPDESKFSTMLLFSMN